MALINFRYYSEALGMLTEATVIMPQAANNGQIGVDSYTKAGPYKCLYLLHGVSGDESSWSRQTSIERYANKCGICVVMPRGGNAFYSNMKYGPRYYDHIANELPAIMKEFFNISDKREDTYIAGLSMGGYGALKIALRNPDRYCAVAGLSPVSDIKALEGFDHLLVPIFGEDKNIPDDDDLLLLAEKQKNNPLRPKLYMGIGTEDFLYQNAMTLRKKIEDCGYDFTYRESSGQHNWDFWDEYIQYVIQWLGL